MIEHMNILVEETEKILIFDKKLFESNGLSPNFLQAILVSYYDKLINRTQIRFSEHESSMSGFFRLRYTFPLATQQESISNFSF